MGKPSTANIKQDSEGHTLLQIFVSYRRADNIFNHMLDIVDRTLDMLNTSKDMLALTDYRIDKFTDIVSIDYGQRWEQKMNEALEDSDILLAFITPGYIESKNCCHEYNHFLENAEGENEEKTDKDDRPRRCIPVFWTSQDKIEANIKKKYGESPDGEPAAKEKSSQTSSDSHDDKNDHDESLAKEQTREIRDKESGDKSVSDNPSKDKNSANNARSTWDSIKEFNGLEAVLPKFIELLKDDAQGSDYDFVKDCVVRWLANKIFIVADSIIKSKQMVEEEDSTIAEAKTVKPLDDELAAALSDHVFHLSTKSSEGTAHVSDGVFIVEKGTKIARDLTASCPVSVIKQRSMHADLIEDCVLTGDIAFSSPSAAAGFVAGRSSNGKTMWTTDENKTINDLEEEYKMGKQS